MYTIKQITTSFSEKAELGNRTFSTVGEFNAEIARVCDGHLASDLSYYKTDVAIVWSDGHRKEITIDASSCGNLSTHFRHYYRHYCSHRAQRPEWMEAKIWRERVAHYRNFFELYAI